MSFKYVASVEQFHATIHMAGDINHARQLCRKFVMEGACVQLASCDYVYTGGMESGFTARIMNYARFPKEKSSIEDQALRLAMLLAEELCQASFSIETTDESSYYENSKVKK